MCTAAAAATTAFLAGNVVGLVWLAARSANGRMAPVLHEYEGQECISHVYADSFRQHYLVEARCRNADLTLYTK